MNGIDVDDLEAVKRFADAQMPIPGAHTVNLAIKHQESICDLEVKFVFCRGLMISDHPTLTLNPWRDAHPRFSQWPVADGLATKGFIYIMPVASHCAVVVFDSETYQFGSADSRIIHANSIDQFILNGLQTINATRLLFDTTVLSPVDLIGALDARNRIRAVEGNGPLPLRPPDLHFSFLKVKDPNPYDDWNLAMLPPRDGAKVPSPPPLDATKSG